MHNIMKNPLNKRVIAVIWTELLSFLLSLLQLGPYPLFSRLVHVIHRCSDIKDGHPHRAKEDRFIFTEFS
ncbi:hypothetical protein D3C78_1718440 [compost metagenome]